MDKIIYIIIAAAVAVFLGTLIMYNLESGVANSQIKTPLDALWWCIATVTTVGYGDIVPVTKLGKIVAMVYMFFGITLISILLSVITSNFYKRRIENEERQNKEKEEKYLKDLLMNKLSNIEEKQSQCVKVIDEMLHVMMKKHEKDQNHVEITDKKEE
jgi:voltage-gated potassium channel